MPYSRRRYLLLGGGTVATGIAGCIDVERPERESSHANTLSQLWTTDAGVDFTGNHHEMAMASTETGPIVAVPQNDLDDSPYCGVVAFDDTGTHTWDDFIPPADCNAHAIGDIGAGEFTQPGRPELFATTYSGDVIGYDALSGEETFRASVLESIGYSAPIVTDLAFDGEFDTNPDGEPLLAILDFEGHFSLLRSDGTRIEQRTFEQPVFSSPIVADLTGDGTTNIAFHYGRFPAKVVCFNDSWEVEWEWTQERASRTFELVERDRESDSNPAIALVDDRTVRLLDGATGDPEWETTLEAFDPVIGGSDGSHLYLTFQDGTVRALAIDSGELAWESPISEDEPRMPPAALGSVRDSDGTEIVAAGFDGTLAVFDQSGEKLASTQFEESVYTRPLLGDVTGDGTADILLVLGDANIVAFQFEE